MFKQLKDTKHHGTVHENIIGTPKMQNNLIFFSVRDSDSSLSFMIAKNIQLLIAIALRVRKSDNN